LPDQDLTTEKALERAKSFSEKYVEKSDYVFFPEADVVEVVQQGLAENEIKHGYRYCP
jgi:ferredoxin-thioredoxin reductase catalytic subunit